MRYMFYECSDHGRLEEEGYQAKRKGIIKEVRCKQCDNVAEQKFIIVCKYHGELTADLIKPVKKGHGACRICFRQTANAKRNDNRAEFNAKMALDRDLNPEKWDKIYKKQYQNKREHQGDMLSLIKVCAKRRITLEEYGVLFQSQDNKCAICNKAETCIDGRSKDKKPRRLSIDHCHITGKVRGLLCHSCNTAIGKFNDDLELFQKAMDYIIQHR